MLLLASLASSVAQASDRTVREILAEWLDFQQVRRDALTASQLMGGPDCLDPFDQDRNYIYFELFPTQRVDNIYATTNTVAWDTFKESPVDYQFTSFWSRIPDFELTSTQLVDYIYVSDVDNEVDESFVVALIDPGAGSIAWSYEEDISTNRTVIGINFPEFEAIQLANLVDLDEFLHPDWLTEQLSDGPAYVYNPEDFYGYPPLHEDFVSTNGYEVNWVPTHYDRPVSNTWTECGNYRVVDLNAVKVRHYDLFKRNDLPHELLTFNEYDRNDLPEFSTTYTYDYAADISWIGYALDCDDAIASASADASSVPGSVEVPDGGPFPYTDSQSCEQSGYLELGYAYDNVTDLGGGFYSFDEYIYDGFISFDGEVPSCDEGILRAFTLANAQFVTFVPSQFLGSPPDDWFICIDDFTVSGDKYFNISASTDYPDGVTPGRVQGWRIGENETYTSSVVFVDTKYYFRGMFEAGTTDTNMVLARYDAAEEVQSTNIVETFKASGEICISGPERYTGEPFVWSTVTEAVLPTNKTIQAAVGFIGGTEQGLVTYAVSGGPGIKLLTKYGSAAPDSPAFGYVQLTGGLEDETYVVTATRGGMTKAVTITVYATPEYDDMPVEWVYYIPNIDTAAAYTRVPNVYTNTYTNFVGITTNIESIVSIPERETHYTNANVNVAISQPIDPVVWAEVGTNQSTVSIAPTLGLVPGGVVELQSVLNVAPSNVVESLAAAPIGVNIDFTGGLTNWAGVYRIESTSTNTQPLYTHYFDMTNSPSKVVDVEILHQNNLAWEAMYLGAEDYPAIGVRLSEPFNPELEFTVSGSLSGSAFMLPKQDELGVPYVLPVTSLDFTVTVVNAETTFELEDIVDENEVEGYLRNISDVVVSNFTQFAYGYEPIPGSEVVHPTNFPRNVRLEFGHFAEHDMYHVAYNGIYDIPVIAGGPADGQTPAHPWGTDTELGCSLFTVGVGESIPGSSWGTRRTFPYTNDEGQGFYWTSIEDEAAGYYDFDGAPSRKYNLRDDYVEDRKTLWNGVNQRVIPFKYGQRDKDWNVNRVDGSGSETTYRLDAPYSCDADGDGEIKGLGREVAPGEFVYDIPGHNSKTCVELGPLAACNLSPELLACEGVLTRFSGSGQAVYSGNTLSWSTFDAQTVNRGCIQPRLESDDCEVCHNLPLPDPSVGDGTEPVGLPPLVTTTYTNYLCGTSSSLSSSVEFHSRRLLYTGSPDSGSPAGPGGLFIDRYVGAGGGFLPQGSNSRNVKTGELREAANYPSGGATTQDYKISSEKLTWHAKKHKYYKEPSSTQIYALDTFYGHTYHSYIAQTLLPFNEWAADSHTIDYLDGLSGECIDEETLYDAYFSDRTQRRMQVFKDLSPFYGTYVEWTAAGAVDTGASPASASAAALDLEYSYSASQNFGVPDGWSDIGWEQPPVLPFKTCADDVYTSIDDDCNSTVLFKDLTYERLIDEERVGVSSRIGQAGINGKPDVGRTVDIECIGTWSF